MLWKLASALVGVLVLSACVVPVKTSTAPGSVVLALGHWGRTVLPDLAAVVDHYEVSLTLPGGSVLTQALGPAETTTTWTGMIAGPYEVAVTAVGPGAVPLASGTQSGVLADGGRLDLAVDLVPVSSTSGTGSISLAIRVPLSIGYGRYSLFNALGDEIVWRSALTFTSSTSREATVAVSNLPAGAYTLYFDFTYDAGGVAWAGSYVEALNVWPGLVSNRWLSPAGVLTSVLELTAADLGASSAELLTLTATVAGAPTALTKVPTTATQALSPGFSPSETAYFVAAPAGAAVVLTPQASSGQTVNCSVTTDNGASTTSLGSQASLTANQTSVVTVVVTSPDGTTKTYQVTVVVPEALNGAPTEVTYTHSVPLLGRAVARYTLALASPANWVTLSGLPASVRVAATRSDGSPLTLVAGTLDPGDDSVVLTLFNTTSTSFVSAPPTLILTDVSFGNTADLSVPLAQGEGYGAVTLASDGSYLYFAGQTDSNVFRQDLAGTGAPEVVASGFSYPHGLAYANGQLFVSDMERHAIYRIDLATREKTLFAGAPGAYGDVPSDSSTVPGSAARFNNQRGLATDGTWLYVADERNQKVRKISLATGEVTTLAGSGTPTEADGTGAAASFWGPVGLALYQGTLYVADFDGKAIRKVDPTSGLVTTFLSLTTNPWAPDTDGTYLYVPSVSGGSGSVEKYSLADQTLQRTYAGFRIPYAVLISPQNPALIYTADPFAKFVQARY